MGKKAEGAFYVWTTEEIDEVLGADTERGKAFRRHYYVKLNGNIDLSLRRWGATLSPVCNWLTLLPFPDLMVLS